MTEGGESNKLLFGCVWQCVKTPGPFTYSFMNINKNGIVDFILENSAGQYY